LYAGGVFFIEPSLVASNGYGIVCNTEKRRGCSLNFAIVEVYKGWLLRKAQVSLLLYMLSVSWNTSSSYNELVEANMKAGGRA